MDVANVFRWGTILNNQITMPGSGQEKSVPSQLDSPDQKDRKPMESRRSFLAKLGIGAAALALVAGPLSAIRGVGSNSNTAVANQEFHGDDSIFHPAVDPRQDPRRTNHT